VAQIPPELTWYMEEPQIRSVRPLLSDARISFVGRLTSGSLFDIPQSDPDPDPDPGPQPIILLRMDGTNDSTTFTDSGASAYTVTANGNAKISTTSPKFGSGAALLDGAGDWLYIASPSGNLGAEWTIDMWARWNSLTNGGLFHVFNGTPGNSQANLALGWEPTPSPAFKVYFNGSGFGASRAYTPTVGQYYHIRLTKTGGDLRLFVEGVLQGAAIADSNSYSSSMGINVGLYYDAAYTFNGRIDEFAVFDTCLSTTGFTPPAVPW
jgi:hypothetical protein